MPKKKSTESLEDLQTELERTECKKKYYETLLSRLFLYTFSVNRLSKPF